MSDAPSNRKLVAFSIGNRSGLMFYVSCDSTSNDYRVFIGNQADFDELTTVLPRRELISQSPCRRPDHSTVYVVMYKGRPIDVDTWQDCTQLSPDDYIIAETTHGVVITKQLFVKE